MIKYLDTHNTSLLLSTANKSHYPQDDLSEAVLVGRSSVGKLSLINTLLGRKNLTRTSSKPGKTRSFNFYNIDDKLRSIDMPGYDYTKASKPEHVEWGKMTEEYLVGHDNLCAVVSLVDSRHDSSADDVQMHDLLKYHEIPIIVVATRADKIPRGKWNKHEPAIKKKLNFGELDKFIIFSSANRAGLDESWDSTLGESW